MERRKQPRISFDKFLVQIVAAHGDARVAQSASLESLSPRGARVKAERSWEPGTHVELNCIAGKLSGRAGVVYCKAVGEKSFVVGLEFITLTNDSETRRNLPAYIPAK